MALKKKRRKPTRLKGKSAALLRKNGWIVGDVERHTPVHITFDFLGFADLIGIKPGWGAASAFQVCHADRYADHRETIMGKPKVAANVRAWLLCGNRLYLHVWAERSIVRRGTKNWQLREEQIKMTEDGELFSTHDAADIVMRGIGTSGTWPAKI